MMTPWQLYEKFQHSGINGAPIITDEELNQLHEFLELFKTFCLESNNWGMAYYLRALTTQISDVIVAREINFVKNIKI